MFQIIKQINGKITYLKSTKENISFRWTNFPNLGIAFDANLTPTELYEICRKFKGDFVIVKQPE